ncbi:MAG TPA: thrombospondin type 3 repeat-containing protein [Saprospiraceae bacterium]|nr:thrombospondin type 3 repeat-containing protein [Saprospiraceae bacterium]
MRSDLLHHYFWILIVFMLKGTLSGSPCPGMILTRQSAVDSFPLLACDSIGGDLIIRGHNITNLDSLIYLKYVAFNLQIDTTDITDLSGLANVKRCDAIEIRKCNYLTDVSALSGLDTLGFLYFHHCAGIKNLTLTHLIISGFNINYNDSLFEINVFPGNLIDLPVVGIDHNPNLSSIKGFSEITQCNILSIEYNAKLEIVDAFKSLTVAGGVDINYNKQLKEIHFLNNLKIINLPNGFGIRFNDSLRSILLPSMISCSNMYIIHNPKLNECCFIANLLIKGVQFNQLTTYENGLHCNYLADILQFCHINDADNDQFLNQEDNCPFATNITQADADEDGVGDACDNCPLLPNPLQEDSNQNLVGDVCEIAVAGKIGINTITPSAALHLASGDIYIQEPGRGIIIKTFNGLCYKITADEKGVFRSILISCPN